MTSNNKRILRVAVPSPLRRLFDYLLPETATAAPLPGTRVRVPFGNREVVGLLVSVAGESEQPREKLRPVTEVLDEEPLIGDTLLELFLWAGSYYQHPQGDALLSALPVLLRKGEALPRTTDIHWRLSTHGKGLPASALSRAPRQQQLLNLLQDRGHVSRPEIDRAGISRNTIRSLEQKGLIESFDADRTPATTEPANLLKEDHLALYPAQRKALDVIELHGYNCYLLEGETGSGKTEVYLQAIEKVLRYGRQALVLVPEISLTPQTVKRFQQRFSCPVAILHSGLTDRERLLAWNQARTGEAGVVIGTRSAIFTPLANPGILIVDEEHDGSYKQQDGFRYSARDVAVMRAHREKIPLLLGSATPSLESLYNCRRDRYRQLILKGRAGNAAQPEWRLLDIRKSTLKSGFSAPLLEAIGAQLAAGNQVLVFLNRRGYAPTLICHDCGWVAGCPRCDARLTVHRSDRQLLCHHCEYRQPIPYRCPDCRSDGLQFLGLGTERGEEVLEALFPGFPILRVDRDTTRRKHAMREVVERVDSGKPCILLGTQILAKGHHFPGVTLVAILDADSGLFSPDFRATERMGQLITQVAGRAGRGDRAGTVIIQSHLCDHPLLTTLSTAGYAEFASDLLRQRELAALPPVRNMALVRGESLRAADAENLLLRARELLERWLPPGHHIGYLGPLPAAMEKRGGRYRYQLSVTAADRPQLQSLLTRLGLALESEKLARRVRWAIDVDPQDT